MGFIFMKSINKSIKKSFGLCLISVITVNLFALPPLKIKQNVYNEILNSSLISKGNNYRLKNVIEKMKNGQEVWVATLGGSITEGIGPTNYTDGYAYQFLRLLQNQYNSENIHLNNAGLSGTPSLLGLLRYDSDVVERFGKVPDLLIVEFAVNDDDSLENQKAFEGIIRKALQESPETAVIALYSAAEYGNTRSKKEEISNYYSVPQIDVLEAVNLAFSKKKLKNHQFYTDNVHPTKEGHQIIADCLMNLVKVVEKSDFDEQIELPENLLLTPGFDNFVRIYGDDQNVKIIKGAFDDTDTNTQSLQITGKGNFPKNWFKKYGTNNESFVMKINCKNLILTYKVQGYWLPEQFGLAEIYVDGEFFGSYDGGKKQGWNNCENLILIDEEKPSNHVIEVKMAEDNEKLAFTIVAMGYSK